MSLESQIAELVTATNALLNTFNNKNKTIDASVQAAIAAIPVNYKKLHVDQVKGDDSATGSVDAPLKTINKALAMTPYGGAVDVILKADYQMTANIEVDGRLINIYSDTAGVKRKLKSAYYLTAGGAANFLAGFPLVRGGQFMATDITLELPSPAGVTPAAFGVRDCFFTSNTLSGTAVLIVKLSACEVVAAPDWVGQLIGASASAIMFEATGGVFPSNFAGRYINGVAAGTNPATLTNVLTNLSSF
ncbi:hypothetical protein [Pseudomonas juntendi]|uniref:hypothetical protein n=1 Tax=Pseudomonas juntendi TaxID=2666183 RepID=UPI0021B3DC55|nr:hypothetical protein [Pseudomonas juntendi]UXA39130.1 hypothetical protein KZA81_01765 [Pseudomonas juntendi]